MICSRINRQVFESAGHPPDAKARTSLAPQIGWHFSNVAVCPDRKTPTQRTPAISSPSDVYEREADDVADKVVRIDGSVSSSSTDEGIKRRGAVCEDEGQISIRFSPPSGEHLDATLNADAAVTAIQRGGMPLPNEFRSYFEPRFGYDFSCVRLHADAQAADGADAVGARAYTIGRDIAFASGQYAPWTTEGKRLLAHELTHVVQQGYAPLRERRPAGASAEREIASVNRFSDSAYHAGLDEVIPAKPSADMALSTRAIGEFPTVISRQKTSPSGPSGKQGGGNKREDAKKLLKDPCFGEPIDDTKAKCQFTSEQLTIVKVAKEHALRSCSKAIAAINMPGNEDAVKKIAKDYFHLNIRLSERTKQTFIDAIKRVSDNLEKAPIECRTCQDESCNRGLIAFVDARTIVALCPVFFHGEIHKVYLTPRFLIHEAGHLAGLSTPTRDELYCDEGATKENKCPVVDAIHNVDAWSHFIEELAYTI